MIRSVITADTEFFGFRKISSASCPFSASNT